MILLFHAEERLLILVLHIKIVKIIRKKMSYSSIKKKTHKKVFRFKIPEVLT